MHFPDRRPDQTEERILPLINVVFLLLIFFMIAGSLSVTEPFEVAPPESRSPGAADPEPRLILMGRDGRLALDNEPVSEEVLLDAIRTAVEENPEIRIALKADAALAANRLVRFTQALYQAGVKKLHLLTLPEGM